MSRRIKRAISVLLAVMMIVAYMPATAFASSSYDFSKVQLKWRYDGIGYFEYSVLKCIFRTICMQFPFVTARFFRS